MKEDGMVLVCKSRKKQVKETRKNERKAKDRAKVQFWITEFGITLVV